MNKRNIHDAFFRKFFSDKKFAVDIFRVALPPVQFNLFAWESLKPEETSYFDHEGNEKKADLVFTVKLKKNRKAANLVMLLEHKSYNDVRVMQQILEYQTVLYAKHKKPVIPIIVHQGSKELKKRPRFQDTLKDMTPTVRRHFGEIALNFTCLPVDIRRIDWRDKGLTAGPIFYTMAQVKRMGRESFKEFARLCKGSVNKRIRKILLDEGINYFHRYDPIKFSWDWIGKIVTETFDEGDRMKERILGELENRLMMRETLKRQLAAPEASVGLLRSRPHREDSQSQCNPVFNPCERNAPPKIAFGKIDLKQKIYFKPDAGGAYMSEYNIGVDYHKKFTYFVVKDSKGKVLKNGQLPNEKDRVADFLSPFKKDSSAVIESCRNWCVMHDWLEELVDEVVLANPYKVKAIAEAKIKTDKIDASVLADLLRADMVPTCYVAPREVRDMRNLLRERIFFVRMRTMAKNRIITIFDRYPEERKGLKLQTDIFGKSGRSQFDKVALREPDRALIDRELNYIDVVNIFIKEIEEVVEENFKESKNAKTLKTIPGIGKFFSMLIDAEIGTVGRFKNEKSLACYAGLVPSTYSSGGKTHQGRLIKRGNKLLRWAFVEAVAPAIRTDERLRFEYDLLRKRMNYNKAKVAIARKLLTIAYNCLKYKKNYKGMNKLELEEFKFRRAA